MQYLRVLLNRGDQLEVMAALHGGEEATKRKILMTYWWPHLSRMVEQFVKSCDTCQRFQRQKYQERQIFHRHCYL
jgi:tryptophan synthase alpha subunit